jgi:hypothetical protein
VLIRKHSRERRNSASRKRDEQENRSRKTGAETGKQEQENLRYPAPAFC